MPDTKRYLVVETVRYHVWASTEEEAEMLVGEGRARCYDTEISVEEVNDA